MAGGGFRQKINKNLSFFVRIKQESSDYPSWVTQASNVEEAKERYIRDYHQKEGILLDREKIKKNPGLRAISKLLLNSFW